MVRSKKRPHEAPTKGRKVFAGARQKVRRGGGGGSAGGSDDDDPDGDEMMEGALDGVGDDDRDGAPSRREGEDDGEDSDEAARETADEKRLRLAKSYLDKLRAEEAAAASEEEDEDDEDNLRNMDSHDRLANRLKDEALRVSGRVRREIAHALVPPRRLLDSDDDASGDDEGDDRAGVVWKGHRLSVTGLALTADDSTAYSVSKEGGICRWDVETGARTKFPRAPPATVDPTRGGGGPMAPPRCGAAGLLCCAVAQDRNLLCTAGADKRVHVWDTRSQKHVQELASHRGAVTSLAIREGTGQLFSVSEDRTLKVWSLDDMAYVDTLFGHQSDVACVAGQRRERVVTVGRDRTCRFWKVAEDSQLIFRPAPGDGALESCAFASNDTWITGSDDGTVALWSTTKKRAVMSWKGIHGFGGAAARGREDAGAEEDAEAGAEEDAEEDAKGGIRAPKFFDEGEVARALRARAFAQELSGVPTDSASLGVSGVGNAGRWVNAVACARGADVCASGAGDGAIRLWRVGEDAGRQLAPLWCLPARGFVNALAVASSGRFVLAGMGQEPRGGRWARDAHAKNGVLMHRLRLDDDA
jgi:ribosomal RNA-processing protein 9